MRQFSQADEQVHQQQLHLDSIKFDIFIFRIEILLYRYY